GSVFQRIWSCRWAPSWVQVSSCESPASVTLLIELIGPGGAVSITRVPWSSWTKSDSEAHGASVCGQPGGTAIGALVQVSAPPVGPGEVRTAPGPPTATHKEIDGHATAPFIPAGAFVQTLAPPAGSVEVKSWPP